MQQFHWVSLQMYVRKQKSQQTKSAQAEGFWYCFKELSIFVVKEVVLVQRIEKALVSWYNFL